MKAKEALLDVQVIFSSLLRSVFVIVFSKIMVFLFLGVGDGDKF
jgi:hypothetical protein